jgi:hypothetical protein
MRVRSAAAQLASAPWSAAKDRRKT